MYSKYSHCYKSHEKPGCFAHPKARGVSCRAHGRYRVTRMTDLPGCGTSDVGTTGEGSVYPFVDWWGHEAEDTAEPSWVTAASTGGCIRARALSVGKQAMCNTSPFSATRLQECMTISHWILENSKKRANKSKPPCCNQSRAEWEKLPRQSSIPTANLKISVVHGAENLFVVRSVEEHLCHLTIDIGSNISIIQPDVRTVQKHTLIQPVSQSVCTATGEKVPILGKGDLCIKIGSQEAVHADVQGECILGLYFPEIHGCTVDLGDNIMHISGEKIPLYKMGSCSLSMSWTLLSSYPLIVSVLHPWR